MMTGTEEKKGLSPRSSSTNSPLKLLAEAAADDQAMASSRTRRRWSLKLRKISGSIAKPKTCPLSNKMSSISISSSSTVSPMAQELNNLIDNYPPQKKTLHFIQKTTTRCSECKKHLTVTELRRNLWYEIFDGIETKIIAISNYTVPYTCACGNRRLFKMAF